MVKTGLKGIFIPFTSANRPVCYRYFAAIFPQSPVKSKPAELFKLPLQPYLVDEFPYEWEFALQAGQMDSVDSLALAKPVADRILADLAFVCDDFHRPYLKALSKFGDYSLGEFFVSFSSPWAVKSFAGYHGTQLSVGHYFSPY